MSSSRNRRNVIVDGTSVEYVLFQPHGYGTKAGKVWRDWGWRHTRTALTFKSRAEAVKHFVAATKEAPHE